MKNKFLKKLLAVSCSLILCGCSGAVGRMSDHMGTSSSESSVDTTEAPQDTAELSAFSEEVSDNLRRINILPYKYYNAVFSPDGKILTYYGSETDRCTPLSILNTNDGTITNTEIKHNNEQGIENTVYILNGFPVIVNCYDGSITVLNDSLEVIENRRADSDIESYIMTYYVDENTAALTSSRSDELTFVTIGDNGEISLESYRLKIESADYYIETVFPNKTVLLYIAKDDSYNYEPYFYFIEDECLEAASFNDNEFSYKLGELLITTNDTYNEASIYSTETPNMKKVFGYPASSNLIDGYEGNENLYFYTISEDVLTLYRYSMSDGSCTSSISIPADEYTSYFASAAEINGNVYLTGRINDEVVVYIWTPKNITDIANEHSMLSGSDHSIQYTDIINKIQNEYNISVFCGDDAVRYFSDYAVASEDNGLIIKNTLSELEKILAKFPDGFLQEIIDSYSNIEIYLTGKIIPDTYDRNSISDAAAFVCDEGDKQCLVIDITQGLTESTIAHEFMHIIENTIIAKSYSADTDEFDAFYRWDTLNPEGFEYAYVYTSEDGTTIGSDIMDYVGSYYYENSDMDIDSVYFADGYSTTYPTEDRARIFENLFTCTQDTLPEYFWGKNMQIKSAYLCLCIRECFDCIDDSTVLFWENNIDPQYDADFFRENYNYADIAVG